MTNVAVIGAGYWGKNLIRVFHELGCLEAICDTSPFLEGAYIEKYSSSYFSNSPEEILKSSCIKAVAIATPAVTHFGLAKQALLSGKHVFVEKPLALNKEEGQELISLANEKGLILMVGHILQYHPAIRKLKELIDFGHLGKIQYIYSNRLGFGKIRTEENILWSFAPHDISTILMLLEEFPTSIQVSGGEYLQNKIADVTLTTFEFGSGVKGHIFISWLHPFKEQKLIVVGSRKMAVFDDVSEEKLLLYPHVVEWKKRIPVANKAQPEVVPFEMEEPLKAECAHFLECILNSKVPITDGQEGLRVLEVLQTCQKSLDNDGQKISFKRNLENKIKIHPTSEVDEDCQINEGTVVWHFSHVMKGSKIGKDCRIGQNVVIGPNVSIGNGCKIQNNVSVYEGVTLEDNVFCGPSMVFTNVINPRSEILRKDEYRKTLIKKGASIGANATIVCGNNIGSYSFVGAGSVVTKNVPDYAVVVGNPARIISWMCPCGSKILFTVNKGICSKCGKKFLKYNNYVEVDK